MSDVATFLMLCALVYWFKSLAKRDHAVNHQSDYKSYTKRPFIIRYFAVFIVVLYVFMIVMKIILTW